jgi:hypothetical protein
MHLRKATRKFDELLGHGDTARKQSPYKRVVQILLEAAFPPLVSGVVHIILFAFKTQAIVLNIMLLSFTVGLSSFSFRFKY